MAIHTGETSECAGDQIGPYVCWTPTGSLITNSQQGRILAWSPALERVVRVADAEQPSTRVEAAPVGPSRIVVAGRLRLHYACTMLMT